VLSSTSERGASPLKRHRLISAVAAIGLLVAAPAAIGSDGDGIVGGRLPTRAYPAQGALVAGQGFCGGTLIAPTLFLTAAHCIDDSGQTIAPQDIFVYMGDVDLRLPNPPENFFDVVMVDRHGSYDATTHRNDLAVLTLDRPAPFAPMRVIRLDEAPKWAPGTLARIIGWGDTAYGGPPSDVLLEADVPIRPDSDCAAAYPGTPQIPPFDSGTMLCAAPVNGGVDTCQGDSGGPLMVGDGPNLVLVGVTSWGVFCADLDFPGIYVRLGAPAVNAWVNGPRPQASFSVTPPHAGQPVTLASTSSNPEGSFSVFNWDLDGDGAFDDAAGSTVTRTFTAPGSVSIGLHAIQPGGDHAITRQTVTINGLPTATAGGPNGYSVREGGSVQLTGSGSDPEGHALSYAWDLNGDGAFEVNGQTTTFAALTLDGPTTRPAALRVCDSAGGCATSSAIVRVTNAPPRANAGPDRRAKRRAKVRFRMRATDPGRDRLRVLWNFGDGRRASGAVVTHRFRRARTYIVRATVIDDDGARATDRVRVRVTRR
jgi:trypsin/PKD domain-containing protein